MIPGMPNINPKKMQAMLKQMGISQDDIPAERVIIEQEDKRIVIEQPQVQHVKMQGQESFQISGEIREESKTAEMKQDDITLIVEKTGKSKEDARKALDETGDIAEAIIKLSE